MTDFKSGAKAAGLSLGHGWKEGLTGIVRTPRIGYRRHGILGGAAGALVATANGIVKPAVGSLASVTWFSRGMYASVTKKKSKNSAKENDIAMNAISVQSPISLHPSPDKNKQAPEQEEEEEVDDDNNDDIPKNILFAAVVSGYPVAICQQILDEFEKVKKHQEDIVSRSPNQTHKHRRRHLLRRHRRHSDSAL